jgi:hypothetical protein
VFGGQDIRENFGGPVNDAGLLSDPELKAAARRSGA